MNEINKAVDWIIATANDNIHGYQWGGNGPVNFDCSGLVNAAWIAAGVNVNSALRNTTGTVRAEYAKHGFSNVTSGINLATGAGLKKGDVIVNEKEHMAMFVGDGMIVQARSDLDGKSGDSGGQEIRVQAYYNYPWDLVLRYKGDSSANSEQTATQQKQAAKMASVYLPQLRRGMKGSAVKAAQLLLIANGCSCGAYGADGDFGLNTYAAVSVFQKGRKLSVDGIVGPETWAALIGGTEG